MFQRIRIAALATAVIVALGAVAFAQYRDEDDVYYQGYPTQARQYGYQHGYRDGYAQGRHEGRENDPNDFRLPDWGQATRGYEQWMGPVEVFQSAYRDGYRNGFRAGYQSVNHGWGDGDNDGDDWGYSPGSSVYGSGFGYGGNIAYRIGYQDGANQAREDTYKSKPFNANPRGKYDDRDHGYRREYGDKSSYRAEYTNGYRVGYESAFRRY